MPEIPYDLATLSAMAERLSDSYVVAETSPAIIAHFAYRVKTLLNEQKKVQRQYGVRNNETGFVFQESSYSAAKRTLDQRPSSMPSVSIVTRIAASEWVEFE